MSSTDKALLPRSRQHRCHVLVWTRSVTLLSHSEGETLLQYVSSSNCFGRVLRHLILVQGEILPTLGKLVVSLEMHNVTKSEEHCFGKNRSNNLMKSVQANDHQNLQGSFGVTSLLLPIANYSLKMVSSFVIEVLMN